MTFAHIVPTFPDSMNIDDFNIEIEILAVIYEIIPENPDRNQNHT